jgi:murein DD-endopeptidase MepM/ murein hydrolase activator NlpD
MHGIRIAAIACVLTAIMGLTGAEQDTARPTIDRRAMTTAVDEQSQRWVWPLAPRPPVHRRFDPPDQPWLAGHRGVDLGGDAAAVVRSAGAGVVAFAGPVAGRPVVSIDHPNGLRTTYEPVVASIRRGDTVAAGDPIGTLQAGHAGCPVDACLHWGLRRGPTYLDPLLLVRPVRVRLKPL